MSNPCCIAGADSGFQVKGGTLKKIVPSGGRREHFWGISYEKITILCQKIFFFSNFRGGAHRVHPLDLLLYWVHILDDTLKVHQIVT